MLPRDLRLNLKRSFKFIASGQKLTSTNLTAFYRFSDNLEPKVGISLSTKQFKKAHLRNRARRLISQIVQNNYHRLPPKLNLIIMPTACIFDKRLVDLESEFVILVRRIKSQ